MLRSALQTAAAALAVAVVAAAAAGPSAAQPDAGEKVILVIRTGPSITRPVIEEAVENTLKNLTVKAAFAGQPVTNGPPLIRLISPVEFNAYQRLENPDAPLSPLPSITLEKDQLAVRQLPAAEPTWEFSLLGLTPQEITKLDVTYDDAADKAVSLTPSTKQKDPLTLTQFGSYVLQPPAAKRPVRFVAHVRELGQKEERKVSGEWPQGDNYFLIRLNGFKGDRAQFEAVIKDKEKVGGTALEAFNIKSDVTLGIGEAGATDDEQEEEVIEGNKLYVNIPPLRRDDAARVYMLFPMTAKEAADKTAELNKLAPGRLSAHIAEAGPIPATQEVVITPESRAQWLELPKIDRSARGGGLRPGAFGRALTLVSGNPAEVTPAAFAKLLEKFPEAHRVVVYEFDRNNIRNALFYKRTPGQKERTLANASPMAAWPVQLARLAGQAPPEKK
ncbi:MAG TPA: hypothetical protein VD866_06160 [Urbifossiella sp.]|nr:hypothetical protein [Urbifossiella sp.]